ncbi:hypothetical protein KMT30_06800 [Streptomyces sp. IBSBF 2953]|nr:hypothetical protein [Streptomyces hayashii]
MAQQPIPADLGQRAYAAYGEVTGGLTHDGRAMPAWEDLGEQIQQAWTVAARAIWDQAQEGGTR